MNGKMIAKELQRLKDKKSVLHSQVASVMKEIDNIKTMCPCDKTIIVKRDVEYHDVYDHGWYTEYSEVCSYCGETLRTWEGD